MAVRLYNKAIDGRWIMKLEASFDTSDKVISAEVDAAMEKIHSSLKTSQPGTNLKLTYLG